MRGLQPKPKKSNAVDDPTAQPKLGLIKGNGTGTSDDIKTDVPVGSYIMPADSTAQMGAENLEQMGNPRNVSNVSNVPVNVSNGEYAMPPEQVQAVGAQVLDQMRDQTHMPVESNPEQKPELFFANGGLVDPNDPRYNQQAALRNNQQLAPRQGLTTTNPVQPNTMRTVTPLPNPPQTALPNNASSAAPAAAQAQAQAQAAGGLMSKAGGFLKGVGKGGVVLGTVAAPATVWDTPTEQYRERFGLGQPNPDDSNGMQFAKDLGVRALGAASDIGNVASFGLAGNLYRDKQRIAADNQAAAAANFKGDPVAAAAPAQPTTSNPFVPPPAAPATTSQQPAQPQVPAAGLPNNIIRNGNSFSGSNIGAGYTINGQPSGMSATNPQANSVQNQQAVQGLLARTPEFGQGMGIDRAALNNARQQAGAINAAQQIQARQYEDRQRIENDLRMARSAMPVGNAQGQTKSQQDMVANLQNQLNAVSAQGYDEYKNQTNNNAALDKQLMGDQAATERTNIQEAGATARNTLNNQTDFGKFGLTNNLENRKFNSDEQAKAPANQQAKRIESLRQQYDAAKTPEDRKSILDRINEISGAAKSNSDRFKAVNGPETVDPTTRTAVKGAPLVFDSQTGQFVDSGVPQAAAKGKNVEPNDGDTFRAPDGSIVYWSKEKQQYMPVG